MPIYEFWCQACGHTEERMLPFKDSDALFPCQKCGAKMTKKISIPSVFLFDFPSLDAQDIMNKEDKRK